MSDKLEQYLAAGINFGNMQRKRDFRGGNRFAVELDVIGRAIRASEIGQQYLLALLGHDDPYVQLWAAKDCLFFDPTRAVPVLEQLGQMQGLISLSATTTLEEWRAGRLE